MTKTFPSKLVDLSLKFILVQSHEVYLVTFYVIVSLAAQEILKSHYHNYRYLVVQLVPCIFYREYLATIYDD